MPAPYRFEEMSHITVHDDVVACAMVGYLTSRFTFGPPDEPMFVFNRTKDGVGVRGFFRPEYGLPEKHWEQAAEARKREMWGHAAEIRVAMEAFLAACELFKPQFVSEKDEGRRRER